MRILVREKQFSALNTVRAFFLSTGFDADCIFDIFVLTHFLAWAKGFR